MPPSASPRSASSTAAARNLSIDPASPVRRPAAHPSIKATKVSTRRCGMGLATPDHGGSIMLHMALVFLVIGLIAALLGFTTIAGASIAIAKFLAGLFLLLFLVFLIIGLTTARRVIR